MAKASFLTWLAFWALSVQLAGTCLRCWPDAAEYFSYDAHLLLQNAETSDKLDKLFLGSPEDRYYYGYLGTELGHSQEKDLRKELTLTPAKLSSSSFRAPGHSSPYAVSECVVDADPSSQHLCLDQ